MECHFIHVPMNSEAETIKKTSDLKTYHKEYHNSEKWKEYLKGYVENNKEVINKKKRESNKNKKVLQDLIEHCINTKTIRFEKWDDIEVALRSTNIIDEDKTKDSDHVKESYKYLLMDDCSVSFSEDKIEAKLDDGKFESVQDLLDRLSLKELQERLLDKCKKMKALVDSSYSNVVSRDKMIVLMQRITRIVATILDTVQNEKVTSPEHNRTKIDDFVEYVAKVAVYTVVELRSECLALNLPSIGKKFDLLNRIVAFRYSKLN